MSDFLMQYARIQDLYLKCDHKGLGLYLETLLRSSTSPDAVVAALFRLTYLARRAIPDWRSHFGALCERLEVDPLAGGLPLPDGEIRVVLGGTLTEVGKDAAFDWLFSFVFEADSTKNVENCNAILEWCCNEAEAEVLHLCYRAFFPTHKRLDKKNWSRAMESVERMVMEESDA